MSSEEKKAWDLSNKREKRGDLSINLMAIDVNRFSQTTPLAASSKLAISPTQIPYGKNELTANLSELHPSSFSTLSPSLSLSSLSREADSPHSAESGFYTPRFFHTRKKILPKRPLPFQQKKPRTYGYGYRGYLEEYSDDFNVQLRRIWGVNSFKEGTTQALCMEAIIKLDLKFKPLTSIVGMMWFSSLIQALSLQRFLTSLLEFDRTASFILREKQGFYATYQDIMGKLLGGSYETVFEVYPILLMAKEFIDANCKLKGQSAQDIESAYLGVYTEFKHYSVFVERHQSIVSIKSKAILSFDTLSRKIDALSAEREKLDRPNSYYDKKIKVLKEKRKEKNKSYQEKEERKIIGKIEQFEACFLRKEMLSLLEDLGEEEIKISRYEKISVISLPELSLEDIYDQEVFSQKGILICQHFFNAIRNIRPLFYTNETSQLYVNKDYRREICSIKERPIFESYIKEKYVTYSKKLLANILTLALEYMQTEMNISFDCQEVLNCVLKMIEIPPFEYNYNESHSLFFETAMYFLCHQLQPKLEPVELSIDDSKSSPSSKTMAL